MKERFLFVGGKADGQIIEVPDGRSYWEIPVVEEGDWPLTGESYHAVFKKKIYRKMFWESDDKNTFSIFVFEKLSNHEVMEMILDNYQPKIEVEGEQKIKRFENMLERCVKTLEEVLRSPFLSNKLMDEIWKLVFDVKKFLFKESDKN
jgi:hypothetical protein